MSWLSELFSGGSKAADAAAAEARRQAAEIDAREKKRQSDIKAGQGSIDDAFSMFDPAYFDRFQQTYKDAYNQPLKDQYDRALGKLTAQLSGRGVLASSIGGNALGDLTKTRADAEANVGSQSIDATNKLRGEIDSTKSGLYDLNLSAADPAMMASRAGSAATSIVAPSSFGSLGDVFGAALKPFGAANYVDKTRNVGVPAMFPWNRGASEQQLAGGGGYGFASGSGSAVFG